MSRRQEVLPTEYNTTINFMTLILLILGLGILILGAEWLVNGSSAIARKAGVSEFVIGVTIVGFGTSFPELVVSLNGAFHGNADIAIGNVVGSNIFNILFILGVTALIKPVIMTEVNRKRDIPITLFVTLLLVACGMNHSLFGIGSTDTLTRLDGVVFLLIFALYVFYSFKTDDRGQSDEKVEEHMKVYKAVAFVILGLAGLIYGGNLFVKSATELARATGVSDKFIAVTILAGGTSLPELATSLVAIRKNKDQLALGNILGSNVFNILLILGCSSLITPLSFAGIEPIDIAAFIVSIVLLLLWAYTGKKRCIDRWEAAIMLLCIIAYYYMLFISR